MLESGLWGRVCRSQGCGAGSVGVRDVGIRAVGQGL